ncbi:MAG: hypothetical protein JW759_03750 [Candidatus Coatesbacteria bacterium]|nr:hypothetical protein [Candidatus Coatesbacteria bacterium]
MSHLSGRPLAKRRVLSEREQSAPLPRSDPKEAPPQFSPAEGAEITRRQTELLDKLLAMPVKDRGPYLEAAAKAAADDYENDPEVTEFTCLDGEDFEE